MGFYGTPNILELTNLLLTLNNVHIYSNMFYEQWVGIRNFQKFHVKYLAVEIMPQKLRNITNVIGINVKLDGESHSIKI